MVCGADKTLVETRRAILARAGYKVLACTSAGESRSEIESSEVDLLVLCSSLSREQQCQLLDISHKVRPGEKSLVVMARHRVELSPSSIDIPFQALDGPAHFMNQVASILTT